MEEVNEEFLKKLKQKFEKKFDEIVRPSLYEKFEHDIASIINEVKHFLDSDLIGNIKKSTIENLSNALEDNENYEILEIYKKHIEEKLPCIDPLFEEISMKIIDNTIFETRNLLIEEMLKQLSMENGFDRPLKTIAQNIAKNSETAR